MNTVTLDRYEMFSLLGRGAIGVVYRARDSKLKRVVAIKVLRQIFLKDKKNGPEARARFERECLAASSLSHPNIVTILDSGYTEIGLPYIVMEYIPGTGLQELISNGQRLEPAIALHYLRQLGSAIDYAHERGVIHRDLKPSNVVIDKFDHPHLLDFSTAKFAKAVATCDGEFVGTLGYAAPEQLKGGKVDHRSDLYSFATMAYAMLTGRMPFAGDGLMNVVNSVSCNAPLSVSLEMRSGDILLGKTARLDSVFKKALSLKPDARYQSAGAFVSDMREALGLSLHDTKVVEELIDRSGCRKKDIPPHKYGKERSNSFGRTGIATASFYKQYLLSQVSKNTSNNITKISSNYHPVEDTITAQCSNSTQYNSTQLHSTPRNLKQFDLSQDSAFSHPAKYFNYPLHLMLFVAISGALHPFLSSVIGYESNTTAIATPQRNFSSLFNLRDHSKDSASGVVAISQLPSHVPYTPANIISEIAACPIEDRSLHMEENILRIAAAAKDNLQLAAIKLLAETTHIDRHKVTELLIDLLNSPDRLVRANASRSLAIVAGGSSIGLLRNQAGHETDPFVQRVLAYSIQKYASKVY